jgi:lysozyme family protein
MADFFTAVSLTLAHEGGYTNNPADPGKATNMGITQDDLPAGVDVRYLTRAQAQQIYQQKYWNPLYAAIESQAVANKLFDLGVLFGIGTAIKIWQQTLGLAADGIFGPLTLQLTNNRGETVLAAYLQNMISHARAVVAADPKTAVFLQGWINRINS